MKIWMKLLEEWFVDFIWNRRLISEELPFLLDEDEDRLCVIILNLREKLQLIQCIVG